MSEIKIDEKTQEAIDEVLEDKNESSLEREKQSYRYRTQNLLNTVLYLIIVLEAVWLYKMGILFNSFGGGAVMTGIIYFPLMWLGQAMNNKTWKLFREFMEASDSYEKTLFEHILDLRQTVSMKDEKIKAQENHIELLAASVEKLTPKVEVKVKKTKAKK